MFDIESLTMEDNCDVKLDNTSNWEISRNYPGSFEYPLWGVSSYVKMECLAIKNYFHVYNTHIQKPFYTHLLILREKASLN